MELRIKYGKDNNVIDVTRICVEKLLQGNLMRIPSGENNRCKLFTDPLVGILKNVYVLIGDKTVVCEYQYSVEINLENGSLSKICTDENFIIDAKIAEMHSSIKIKYGSMMDELPEQKMAVRYLTGNEKVLEIGGNIGRNSLIIAHILKSRGNVSNFVSLECDENIAKQFVENRDLNNFDFHIENSALSKRKLMQKGWDTFVSNELLPGYKWVNTITLDELNAKYNIVFDTLVLDCEGAFYYILMDMPEILNNINLIIMENDYHEIEKKNFVDYMLFKNGFHRDYAEAGGWGPCLQNFFEVWKK